MRDLDGPSTPRHWQRIAPPHWLNLARHSNDGTQPKNVTDRCALRDQRGKPEEPLLRSGNPNFQLLVLADLSRPKYQTRMRLWQKSICIILMNLSPKLCQSHILSV